MPKIVNHQEVRETILEDSFELFARRGYASVSMRTIAAELKISTGTLYHYFPTKEAIFQEMFGFISRRVVEDAVAELSREPEAGRRLDLLFDYTRRREQHFQNMLFLIMDYYRQQSAEEAGGFIQQIVGYFRQMIAEQLGYDDPDRAAATFSMLLGIVMHRLLDPGLGFERLLAAQLQTFGGADLAASRD